eukprot:1955946-Karenia_brevis.AAC.1
MKPLLPRSNKIVIGKLIGLLTWERRPANCQRLKSNQSSKRTQSYGNCNIGWWQLYNNWPAGGWPKADT